MSKTIYERLREDHQTQRTLIDLVLKTKGDSDGRRELFARLKSEALAHAAVEERVFYSTLMAQELTRDKAGHSVQEHNEAESIFDELADEDMSSPGWLQRFETLAEELRHHMDEEEHEVFQLAGKVLSRAQEEQMAEQFGKEKPTERHELLDQASAATA